MNRVLMWLGALALLTFSQTAAAAEASGVIEQIDEIQKTVTIDGTTYQYSTDNTLGAGFEELEPGDSVHIMYMENEDGSAELVEVQASPHGSRGKPGDDPNR